MPEVLGWTMAVFLYGVLAGTARQLLIARPTWELAKGEVRGLISLILEKMDDTTGKGPLRRAMEFLKEADNALGGRPLLLWHGERELAAWRLVHMAERELVAAWEGEEVRARLVRGLAQLDDFPEGRAKVWRERIEKALGISGERCGGKGGLPESPQGGGPGAGEGVGAPQGDREAMFLLREFLAELYQIRDSRYAQLLTLHNKAIFLLGMALLLAWGLGLLWTERVWPWWWPHGPDPLLLYLAGLGGGILSRLTRLVRTQQLPTDYGGYWVPLFLAPALGGLAAMGGALVLRALLEAQALGRNLEPLLYPFGEAGAPPRGGPGGADAGGDPCGPGLCPPAGAGGPAGGPLRRQPGPAP
ncbi:hypothetical protein [Thermus sp.]|uniref:hypothetical protein n=1 Tax=Thermus sp. TaxID=275 RepID=UPI00298EF07B|nr:hypothetical protein [Thermus sp.]MDW8358851.1 hypothetical protein [Thermus sp.]